MAFNFSDHNFVIGADDIRILLKFQDWNYKYQNEPHSNTSSEPCVKKMFYLVRLARINITSMMTKIIRFHLFQLFRSEFVVGADDSRILQNFKN